MFISHFSFWSIPSNLVCFASLSKYFATSLHLIYQCYLIVSLHFYSLVSSLHLIYSFALDLLICGHVDFFLHSLVHSFFTLVRPFSISPTSA